jgi:hypothetical protein
VTWPLVGIVAVRIRRPLPNSSTAAPALPVTVRRWVSPKSTTARSTWICGPTGLDVGLAVGVALALADGLAVGLAVGLGVAVVLGLGVTV